MTTKLKRLENSITLESPRVRIEVYYDKLISNIEAQEKAINMIIDHINGTKKPRKKRTHANFWSRLLRW